MLLFAVPLELVLLAQGKELRAKFWAAEAAFWVEVDKFCARELCTRVAGVDKARKELIYPGILLCGQLFLCGQILNSQNTSTCDRTLCLVLSLWVIADQHRAKPVPMPWVVPPTKRTIPLIVCHNRWTLLVCLV